SIYDAVNGIARTHEVYAVPSAGPASASREAAASAAAHKALVTLFPTHAAAFDDLNTTTLAAIPNGPQKNTGIAWGESVAQQILSLRSNDGAAAVIAPPSGSGPGVWVPTPPALAAYLLPQWAFVLPFSLPNITAVRPPGPPSLSSAKYLADLAEVKAVGPAVGSTRTADQSQIAQFSADGAG